MLTCRCLCRLEYAYEKRESFVKHVLENVDASGNREAGPSEQDPFAVLGLTRGASAQQVSAATMTGRASGIAPRPGRPLFLNSIGGTHGRRTGSV